MSLKNLLKTICNTGFFFFINTIPVLAQTTIQNPLGAGTTISSVIDRITTNIVQIGTAIAVIVFVVGAWQYLFSFGSEEKVKQAHNTMKYAVIGLIVLLVAKGLTTLITNILRG